MSDDRPDAVRELRAAREHVLSELLAFLRALRRAGVAVPANAGVDAARALAEVGLDDERRVRAALRASLVSRREDLSTFERLFAEFWRRLEPSAAGDEDGDHPDRDGPDAPAGALLGADVAGEADRPDGDARLAGGGELTAAAERPDPAATDDGRAASAYSPSGSGRSLTADDVPLDADDDLAAAVARLTRALATLPGRRWTPAEAGDRPDVRRALRRSVGTGGAVASVPERARRRTGLRGVVLADVSRSVLDTLDRSLLLAFLHAVAAEWRSARLFLFDDDVREVTAAFAEPSVEHSMAALERAEAEWGGGTRIGGAVTALREDHPGAVDRRSVAVVVSDGLEMGDVTDLERGMAWLSRRAGAVCWLNPLAASPEYEPACRGMQAALPYVDGLFAFARPDDVAEAARQLEQHGTGRPVGYEQDPAR